MSKELLHLRLLREELADLDFEDIQSDLIGRRIFTEADCRDLLEETDENFRLDLLFLILEQKLGPYGNIMIINQFLDVLRPYYSWIVERHEASMRNGETGQIIRYKSYQNNTSVPGIDGLNVFRRDYLWQIQRYLKQLKHGVRGQRYLFVYGSFGTGKWTLVSQACENFTIVEHMGYNIFYLNLANCNQPEQILELLENLSIQMEIDYKPDDVVYNGRYPTNEIAIRKRRLLQRFEDHTFRNSLLILSHVRDPALIEAFDLKCKTLVITSNPNVVNSVNENEKFVVRLPSGFSEDETIELFRKVLKAKVALPEEAHQIHRTCKGNPFMIKLIARKMAEYNNIDHRWSSLAAELRSHSIAIENMTIQSILERLTADEQWTFRSLVVFKDNVKVPQIVLQRYWGLTAEETESMANKLLNRGLLEKRLCKDQQVSYMLHYVCYNFLLKETPSEPIANLHRRLVENYSISATLESRREVDLLKFTNDNYFHFYIAYHLQESGLHQLFPQLFKDFGFLEQKLRYTGLPNTVGDLRLYQDYIFDNRDHSLDYPELLTEFLMGAEVLLSNSTDTCLLQLAFNCTGPIATEAKEQARSYDSRVWFHDIDRTHQHQLVQVRSAPIKVRFQNPSSALVSLDNHQITLVDLSPLYSAPSTIFDGNMSRVVDMHMAGNVLVALDETGTINVWSLRNIPLDRNARQHESDGSLPIRRRIQTLVPHPPTDRFTGFCIVSKTASSVDPAVILSEMFAITQNGTLYIFKGLTNFTESMKHNTNIKNIIIIKPLIDVPGQNPKLLFVTSDNQGCIFNLKSTSVECRFSEPDIVNIHYMGNALVFVGENQIRLRKFSRNERNQLQIEPAVVIYKTPTNHRNACSAISDDYEYIILGTTQGISIFSIREEVEVLRTNISQSILDVDIFPLDDAQYRYILISSSEDSGNVINMYSLMVTAQNQLVSNQYQLQDNAVYHADLEADPVTVKTVDRKRVIQEVMYTRLHQRDDFRLISPPIENKPLASVVKRLTQCTSGFYLGLANGDVLRLEEWSNGSEDPEPEVVCNLGGAITLLKSFDEPQLLVAASDSRCKIFVAHDQVVEMPEELCECYLYRDQHMVLLFDAGRVQIFNVQTKQFEFVIDAGNPYGASAINDQYLIVGMTNGDILQYAIEQHDTLELHLAHTYVQPKRITSCALSANGELLAVGYKNGALEIYNTEERKLISTLESHRCDVASLYFSPWKDSNNPQILVSVGEQIVFWSLDSVINNPDSRGDVKRRSNRYKTRPSLTSPALDIHRTSFGSRSSGLSSPLAASPSRNGSFTFDLDEAAHQWLTKSGPSNKPHLLSCIKLIGSAERLIVNRDFNKFFTIDDEGYIYYLRLFQPPSRHRLTATSFMSPAAVARLSNGTSFPF
ncbi:hypothetical protein quinque_006880 [Culex quinquefasciatus]